jgi:hypothetical protein
MVLMIVVVEGVLVMRISVQEVVVIMVVVVRFDDQDESQGSHEEEYDDDENPFAHCGPSERRRERHCAASHDGDNHRGHNRADLDSIARVKLSIAKFSGKEDADAYFD